MKSHSHLTVARHLREKIHPSVLVVTIRGGEQRGMCSATLRVVKDCQRSDWREMRIIKQRINNLEKSEREDFAKRDS